MLLTDRECDLAIENINIVNYFLGKNLHISAHTLEWGEANWSPHLLNDAAIDLIIGVEITCLVKQQNLLIETLNRLCNPNTIILLTFDSIVPPPNGISYEEHFLNKMKCAGFHCQLCCTASVVWESDLRNDSQSLSQIIQNYPLLDIQQPIQNVKYAYLESYQNHISSHSIPSKSQKEINIDKNDTTNSSNNSTDGHHVILFYKTSALHVCQVCQSSYFDIFNTIRKSTTGADCGPCRFHSGFYVCRAHPGDVSSSINGMGDGLGYYGNSVEGTIISKIYKLYYVVL